MPKRKKHNFITRVAVNAITLYQRNISPIIGGRAACRFIPTCSEYARIAIEKYGIGRGCYLAIRRILRCRPGGGWGYDPVP